MKISYVMATVSLENLKFKMLREEFVLMQNKKEGAYTLKIGSSSMYVRQRVGLLLGL